MSINSAVAGAMGNAAHGAVLGHAIGQLRERVYEERALRESAEADVATLRAKVRALELYIKALKASQQD